MAAKKQTTKAKETTKEASKGKTKAGSVAKPKSKQTRAQIVHDLIVEADKSVESQFIVMAEALYEAYHREYFIEWKYEDFGQFCDAELKTHYRKSMYMIDIWDKVKKYDLPMSKVQALGWTKMSQLVLVIDEQNAEKWLADAASMTTRELRDQVKVLRRKAKGQEGPVTTTMKFVMSEGEANIVTEALAEAKKLTDNQNDTLALEMICQDWLQDKGKVPERTSIEDYVAYIEKMFSVKVTWKVIKQNGKKKAVQQAEAEIDLQAAQEKKQVADATIEDILGDADKEPEQKPKKQPKAPDKEADITDLLTDL